MAILTIFQYNHPPIVGQNIAGDLVDIQRQFIFRNWHPLRQVYGQGSHLLKLACRQRKTLAIPPRFFWRSRGSIHHFCSVRSISNIRLQRPFEFLLNGVNPFGKVNNTIKTTIKYIFFIAVHFPLCGTERYLSMMHTDDHTFFDSYPGSLRKSVTSQRPPRYV